MARHKLHLFSIFGGIHPNMKQYINLILIAIVFGLAIFIALPSTTDIFGHAIRTELGLDLVGGAQIILEADVDENTAVTEEAMNTARQIVENRVSGGLGATEAVVQRVGERRISVEIPGNQDPQSAREAVKGTGRLEFVDMSSISQTEALTLVGQKIMTDDTGSVSEVISSTNQLQNVVWSTVLTGEDLDTAIVQPDQTGGYVVDITLRGDGTQKLADFSKEHIGDVLAIVLDKTVLNVPTIQSALLDGTASITGGFDLESANSLAIQLRYGSLPIPLEVVETRSIGPSLGQDSLNRSLVAGAIGAVIVALFMILYYRLPGVVAVLGIIIYGVITFSLYRFIPVTLTLPGIAGFLLSTGAALDANILIFERMKEELRSGKSTRTAITQGFNRAWSSIRDSNLATILVSLVLWYFGGQSGATIVIGFAFTLLVGVVVSLFTALLVTRVLLNIILASTEIENKALWFGI
jgi:preprotein translocase subunit SecD